MLKRSRLIAWLIIVLALPGCTLVIPGESVLGQPPQIKAFSVNPASIENGKSATLSWEISDAAAVVIEPGLGNSPTAGSQQVNPSQTVEFTIIATNKSGVSRSMVRLSVVEPAPAVISEPPMLLSFKSSPQLIWAGSNVVLSWEVLNATSIKLESDRNDSYTVEDPFGSIILQPYLTTVYKLTASNNFGSSVLETTVSIKGDDSSYYASQGGSGWGDAGGGGGCNCN